MLNYRNGPNFVALVEKSSKSHQPQTFKPDNWVYELDLNSVINETSVDIEERIGQSFSS